VVEGEREVKAEVEEMKGGGGGVGLYLVDDTHVTQGDQGGRGRGRGR
jgi:hypothetical protein